MKPAVEYYKEMHFATEGFNKKGRIKTYLISIIKEVQAEYEVRYQKLVNVAQAVQFMRQPDGLLHGPLLDGPELDALNKAILELNDNAPKSV